MGALSSLSGTNTYVSQINYNASGQVTDETLGNGLMQQSCYDTNTLRLTGIRAYPGTLVSCTNLTPANARLNLSYTYQPNGNISQVNDRTRSEILNYTYDDLDRLDTVSGPYSMNYDYNTLGNITNKDTTTYTYGDTAHKHAATSLSGGGGTYTYDANGNMITRVENGQTYSQTFDAENRLISVTVGGQTTQFMYDPDGNLVKKVNPDNSKTLYVGGVYEVDKNAAGTVTRTVTYYPAGGAMRINSTLYYVLKDHLGSASAVTDSSGASIGTQRYYPFGETRLTTGTIYTDKLFTGQREITGLGIYHYNARFYSPKLGRFLSADTIVPSYANPQSLNRFSYTVNNPLRYVDPTGHKETACASQNDPDCSAVDGGPTGNTTTKGNPPKPPDDDDDGPGGNDEGGDIVGNDPPSDLLSGPRDDWWNDGIVTLPIPTIGTPSEGSSSCSSCVIYGGAIIVATGLLEAIFGIAAITAVVFSGPAAIPAIALIILPIETVLGNATLIGVQYIKQGSSRPREDVHIDYLPLLHLFTNPDEGECFP